MGVDGLPVYPDDPEPWLEVEIEDVGRLANPVVVAEGPVPLVDHPSYAVREVAASGASALESTGDWRVGSVRHFYTSFGNHEAAADTEGMPALEVPRFLNGPASSLGVGGGVEIPPRATDLVVAIELAVVVRALASDAADGLDLVVGYTPLVSLCDRSFAEEVVEPARPGERGIPAVYGRWADGFNVVAATPVPLPEHDWRGREMALRIGDRVAAGSTSDYLTGPDELIRTISAMITLFPGDVITLGSTVARLEVARDEYEAGVVFLGGIEGLGEVTVTPQGAR
jgi:2-keto-4-pentenoate hydratase/2-oxohepta-3-ene-1,7-dioic acid hydratase in catechol pathway